MVVKKALFHEGKCKKLYKTDNDREIILEFTDNEAEFDGEKRLSFEDKGHLKNKISRTLFEYLDGYNIPTHFQEQAAPKALEVRKLEMIPILVHVRNLAAGNLCKKFKIKQGQPLKYPVIEYYLKDNRLKDPMILESHAYAFGYADPEEMKHIARMASKINAVLKSFMERRQLVLVDFQLQFGRYQNQVMLGDEITPDTCRIWKMEENNGNKPQILDYSNHNGRELYHEIFERIAGKS